MEKKVKKKAYSPVKDSITSTVQSDRGPLLGDAEKVLKKDFLLNGNIRG